MAWRRMVAGMLLVMFVACAGPADRARTLAPAGCFRAGFEESVAGEFEEFVTAAGRLRADPGHVRVDDGHAARGSRCLHLVGGDERSFVLELAPTAGPLHAVTFRAERWTARAPFIFRVEALHAGRWVPRWRGDELVEVGGFRTRASVPLEAGDTHLRFTCSSPAGVLIDDLTLGRRARRTLQAAEFTRTVVPALAGRAGNPRGVLSLFADGSEGELSLREVVLDLAGTTELADLVSLELRGPGDARLGPLVPDGERVVLRGELVLAEGDNDFALVGTLGPGTNLDHRIEVRCVSVRLSDGRLVAPRPVGTDGALRIGLALRDAGDDGAEVFRIPALVTTRRGSLLAAYDVRWNGWGDLPGNIDVGVSRSTDGGRTFEDMRIALDLGADPAFAHDGVGDASLLVDEATGTIWIAALWSHGDRGWHGSGPGLTPEETGQLLLSRSDDDGRTWSAPRNVTAEVKDPAWRLLLQGPGRGITMTDGTLVFPAQFRAAGGLPSATILYSSDHGATWRVGAGVKSDTTEAQIVELADGSLMLNARDNRGGTRAVHVTHDLGATWQEHASSRQALVDPVCNAALLRAAPDVLVFCNPEVAASPRRRMTLKASFDEGQSWPATARLLLDEGTSAGYSSLTLIDPETLGVLFESSRAQLVFLRVPLAELTSGTR